MFGKICRPCRACTFGQNLGGGARFLISCYTNHTKIPPEYRFRFPIFFISLMRSLVAIVTTRRSPKLKCFRLLTSAPSRDGVENLAGVLYGIQAISRASL